MVHRSIVGSIERAIAHLLGEYGGAFPAPGELPGEELLRRIARRVRGTTLGEPA
ncbi:hypothetical protein AB0M97_28290 [Streptomyces sp. NPDC051207]|uniref:hypothetical protein n=1 Tax=Streptomyces sp. NPDC051207 TaxID=3154641 RepID=UPI00343D04BB